MFVFREGIARGRCTACVILSQQALSLNLSSLHHLVDWQISSWMVLINNQPFTNFRKINRSHHDGFHWLHCEEQCNNSYRNDTSETHLLIRSTGSGNSSSQPPKQDRICEQSRKPSWSVATAKTLAFVARSASCGGAPPLKPRNSMHVQEIRWLKKGLGA